MIVCPVRGSDSVTPTGTAYVIVMSPLVKIVPFAVQVEPPANCGLVLASRFMDASTDVRIAALRAVSFWAFESVRS